MANIWAEFECKSARKSENKEEKKHIYYHYHILVKFGSS